MLIEFHAEAPRSDPSTARKAATVITIGVARPAPVRRSIICRGGFRGRARSFGFHSARR
jgi:hypothetical protein